MRKYTGIDVSHHQDVSQLNAALYDFAYVRATYGVRPDAESEGFAKAFRGASVPFGLYHFLRQGQDIEAQIEAFRRVSDALKPDLRPALDVESNMRYDGSPDWERISDLVGRWLDEWPSCLVYSNMIDLERLGVWRKRPYASHLWLAQWGVEEPSLPCAIWQCDVTGSSGYASGKIPVDINVTHNLEALRSAKTVEPEQCATISDLVRLAHEVSCEKGWWGETLDTGPDSLGAKIALIHSEVSEALECVRVNELDEETVNGKPEGMVVEMADAVIRIADLCGALELDLEGAINRKMAYNRTRPHRHGGKTL